MNIVIVGDSWGWNWNDAHSYQSKAFESDILKGTVAFEQRGDQLYSEAIPLQKMVLEYLGHDVIDVSMPGCDNRYAADRLARCDTGSYNPDIVLINFTDPIRYDYRDADLIEFKKHVHSLDAFMNFLDSRKKQDIQYYVDTIKRKFNKCPPILFIGSHNKLPKSFIDEANQNNDFEMLHCVLENATNYFLNNNAPELNNVNENFAQEINMDWHPDIINYFLEWGNFTDNDPGYHLITWPDGGKHLNASCQIKIIDIVLKYIEDHLNF